MTTLTWDDILADRSLRHLPYKIETNHRAQIIMSPATNWHSDFQYAIARELDDRMKKGRVSVEFAIQTADGVRVPDVTWISQARRAPYGRTTVLPIAPEICIEILSPSNQREALLEKMQLFYERGAEEVWLCDELGNMEFFSHLTAHTPLPASLLCPTFPHRIELDE